MEIVKFDDEYKFLEFLQNANNKYVVIHFSAPWVAQSQQMSDIIKDLKMKYSMKNEIAFIEIEAEKLTSISQKYKISAVPTCLIIQNGKEKDRINGANPGELVKKIENYLSVVVTQKQNLNERLKQLINQESVMVFMKGNPKSAQCGFSKSLVKILNDENVKFGSFDILSDEDVRQGLKEYSNWPTYPQLYINGELVGGIDIVKELIANGELKSMLP